MRKRIDYIHVQFVKEKNFLKLNLRNINRIRSCITQYVGNATVNTYYEFELSVEIITVWWCLSNFLCDINFWQTFFGLQSLYQSSNLILSKWNSPPQIQSFKIRLWTEQNVFKFLASPRSTQFFAIYVIKRVYIQSNLMWKSISFCQ